jgi:transcriptional regulator EpsA
MNLTSVLAQRAPISVERTAAPRRGFELNEADSARFLRIVSESLSISRHSELFHWLCGELQQFLPHQILVSAWGDFMSGEITLDLVSPLPGVRTSGLAACSIDAIVRDAHIQWVAAGRRPLVLSVDEIAHPQAGCQCHIHHAIREMRSLLVHGMRDQRGGHESLYIAMHSGPVNAGRDAVRFTALVDNLVTQIDAACRRVAALPLERGPGAASHVELSVREREILDLVCYGQTNLDIANGLAISPYTVKNHVQRIFRKIGASNRTEAAAKYNELRRAERRALGQG